MAYNMLLRLPEGWTVSYDTLIEEDGSETAYADATGPAGESVELYVGEMPEDNDASDQALANYVEMVGFDENDPEDYSPIIQWPFDKKKAYGFEALCEDDSPMRVVCVEIKQKVLAVANIIADDEASVEAAYQVLVRGLRVSK